MNPLEFVVIEQAKEAVEEQFSEQTAPSPRPRLRESIAASLLNWAKKLDPKIADKLEAARSQRHRTG